MCSVEGCDSSSRGAQLHSIPEDPESRLQWVQFVFEVNGQRLKESSWTDIAICGEHFTPGCFDVNEGTGAVQLKPGAVPSMCVKSEPEDAVEVPECVMMVSEKVETTEAASQCDDFEIDAATDVSGQDELESNMMSVDEQEVSRLLREGKHFVNESCLLQLFPQKCPLCGSKLDTEKVTFGSAIVLNQRCLQCEYSNHWQSQKDIHVSASEDIKPEMIMVEPLRSSVSSSLPPVVDDLSNEDNSVDEGEEDDEGAPSTDDDWRPPEGPLPAEESANNLEEESEDIDDDDDEVVEEGPKNSQLCTDCGSFYNTLKPHTCAHKVKPFACNICGKRCSTKAALKHHSIIHSEDYEHPCRYCHTVFKSRADKLSHEQIHKNEQEPYKCPHCDESFAHRDQCRAHIPTHGLPKVFTCTVCELKFNELHRLQRHSVVHTGQRSFTCKVCERSFNQASHLKSHMRLHTGERPFMCQQCDKRFNHKVSLKSHVQRYHASLVKDENREVTIIEKVSDTITDSGVNNVELNTEQEVQTVKTEEVKIERKKKKKKKSTGRPRGRPKSNTAGVQLPKNRISKSRVYKSKKSSFSKEENESNHMDSDMWFYFEEEEDDEEESEERSRKRPNDDSESDYDPDENKKRKKRRPKKNVVTWEKVLAAEQRKEGDAMN